mmetsp:Transcript_118520/g.342696  ORF Transcript_118520/g.342696 Transcript_118520/m.342696 type:complete len:205 (-) Transcript_118520:751-1365(-)
MFLQCPDRALHEACSPVEGRLTEMESVGIHRRSKAVSMVRQCKHDKASFGICRVALRIRIQNFLLAVVSTHGLSIPINNDVAIFRIIVDIKGNRTILSWVETRVLSKHVCKLFHRVFFWQTIPKSFFACVAVSSCSTRIQESSPHNQWLSKVVSLVFGFENLNRCPSPRFALNPDWLGEEDEPGKIAFEELELQFMVYESRCTF